MKFLIGLFSAFLLFFAVQAQDLSTAQKELIDKYIKNVKKWAVDPEIIKAIKDANIVGPKKEMNQDKWSKAPVLDPTVRKFTKNKAAEALKKLKPNYVSEMFINAADGHKVAFLAKTSNWSHKGKPKHDDPMDGKVWIGKIEVDESSGTQQVQVAVPVFEGEKPIGSLIVGFALAKLK